MAQSNGVLDSLDGYALTFLAGAPVVYHCHHYNLFLDQTIDDALGAEKGTELRTAAAHEAFYNLLLAFTQREGLRTPQERFRASCDLFAAMGHGRVQLLANAFGGQATSATPHYGFAWREKYSAFIKRKYPADAVTAGFAAAAVEVAYDLPIGSLHGTETECIALGHDRCTFSLEDGKGMIKRPRISRSDAEDAIGPPIKGMYEDKIEAIANGLREFLTTVKADSRGLVQGFGVFVTLHQSSYYNRISYDACEYIQNLMPQSANIMHDLLREAGHQCAFNTFGGIMSSPEWEGLVGPHTGAPEDILVYCCAIGRALGFGQWIIEDFQPEKYFVLRTASSYESTYYRARHGIADAGSCFLLQGAALACMQLAHRIDWRNKPALTQEFYVSLFKNGVPWKAEETSCLSAGDPYCEVVVDPV